mmetsp:Transcript_62072/g.166112  ORF Transcript_62072/g.166112 Transcript_62072/m.166112 type:complete len:222 (-) Transcript_62072:449-1114(-)
MPCNINTSKLEAEASIQRLQGEEAGAGVGVVPGAQHLTATLGQRLPVADVLGNVLGGVVPLGLQSVNLCQQHRLEPPVSRQAIGAVLLFQGAEATAPTAIGGFRRRLQEALALFGAAARWLPRELRRQAAAAGALEELRLQELPSADGGGVQREVPSQVAVVDLVADLEIAQRIEEELATVRRRETAARVARVVRTRNERVEGGLARLLVVLVRVELHDAR